mgnify:CR=1 FL=1
MIERDEDTFGVLKAVAEDINLSSRNYNDEIIGIDYYANLQVLTPSQVDTLLDLWHQKQQTCLKERWASVWMVVQVCMLIVLAMFLLAPAITKFNGGFGISVFGGSKAITEHSGECSLM